MFGLFGRKKKNEDVESVNNISKTKNAATNIQTMNVGAVVTGIIQPITNSVDAMFAEKILGDGYLIQPAENDIVSCIDGEVTLLFPTLHAIGLTDQQGHEYLIHVGVDTVGLQGQGFTSFVQVGEKVVKGQKLLSVDFKAIADKVKSTDVMVVFTDKRRCEVIMPGKLVQAGEEDIVNVK